MRKWLFIPMPRSVSIIHIPSIAQCCSGWGEHPPASRVVVSVACCPKFKYTEKVDEGSLCLSSVSLLAVRLAGLDLLAGLLDLLEDGVEVEVILGDNFGGLGL